MGTISGRGAVDHVDDSMGGIQRGKGRVCFLTDVNYLGQRTIDARVQENGVWESERELSSPLSQDQNRIAGD